MAHQQIFAHRKDDDPLVFEMLLLRRRLVSLGASISVVLALGNDIKISYLRDWIEREV